MKCIKSLSDVSRFFLLTAKTDDVCRWCNIYDLEKMLKTSRAFCASTNVRFRLLKAFCRALQSSAVKTDLNSSRKSCRQNTPTGPDANHADPKPIELLNKTYNIDEWTNVTPRLQSLVGRNLFMQMHHPLWLVKERIISYFNWRYADTARRRPMFTVIDNLSPVVTVEQNFDSLLVPANHVSRRKSDSYYINSNYLLRAHTSAHQSEVIRQGLREFLLVGDVYRRDEVDATHFPAFHQMEGVRLRYAHELYDPTGFNAGAAAVDLFERDVQKQQRNPTRQEYHTQATVDLLERDLKSCLEGLVRSLFGQTVQLRWVNTYFPFTHPSWELEMLYDEHFQQQSSPVQSSDEAASESAEAQKKKRKVKPVVPAADARWLEILGCGIMEQKLLRNAGVSDDQVGWAFGLGLERLAMLLYQIPDIRLFWSTDGGVLSQFRLGSDETIRKRIKYRPVSIFPQCINDISFWLPSDTPYDKNDFYDLVRSVAGDLAEQVSIIDDFEQVKTKRRSHCYRIVYRHMEKTLTKEEVNKVHEEIAERAVQNFGVELR